MALVSKGKQQQKLPCGYREEKKMNETNLAQHYANNLLIPFAYQ